MDSFHSSESNDYGDDREHGIDADDRPFALGNAERRMHVRAYNYWASLLGERSLPSIEDLDPASLEEFAAHSVLLDFTAGIENPAIQYLGSAVREECEITDSISFISEVPARSLLSRLTDHYLQIISNAAPVGFEAEFTNQRGAEIMYRGILMPFSTDDDTIDFIYGVINWKEVADQDLTQSLEEEVGRALRDMPTSTPAWADGPLGEKVEVEAFSEAESLDDAIELAPVAPPSSLADWLDTARRHADEALLCESRGRKALYHAIGSAYDFAVASQEAQEDFADLLDDAGIKVQARAPMTAVVKLVFGVSYDKTRLAEFSTALEHGWAHGIDQGAFAAYLQEYAGGLKGLVRDERAARRAERPVRPSASTRARQRLNDTAPIDLQAIDTDADGFAVLVARKQADGSIAVVGALSDAGSLVDQVLRKTAG